MAKLDILKNFRLSSEKSKKFVVDLINNVIDTITSTMESLDNAKADKNHNNINCGKFSHTDMTVIIDTGFLATPKLFKLYYYDTSTSTPVLIAECHPNLDEPFNQIIYDDHIPINSITFDNGIVTTNWYTQTGLTMLWEAYM